MTPKRRTDEITVTIGDREFAGTRTIEGTRVLYQEVERNGCTRTDSARYRPSETSLMDAMARQLLRELVAGRSGSPS